MKITMLASPLPEGRNVNGGLKGLVKSSDEAKTKDCGVGTLKLISDFLWLGTYHLPT
jgi:hypothetical protein